MTESLSRNLVFSLSAHVVVVLFFMLKTVFMPDQPFEIRHAIRVDVVGLPEKLKDLDPSAPLPSNPPSAPIIEEKKAPSSEATESPNTPISHAPTLKAPVLKTKQKDLAKSQEKALNEIKSMLALEKIKKEVAQAQAQARSRTNKKNQSGVEIKGNTVSAGNSLTGLEKIDYDRYFDELEVKIRSEWSIPQWLAESNFKAQVLVLIDERGYIIKKAISRSSGNEVFDDSVLAAIERSSPLPAPPERLRGLLSTSGIIFNFPK